MILAQDSVQGPVVWLLIFPEMALSKTQAESWAFAVDAEALQLLSEAGVFGTRTCKLCDDGVVVMGEYGLSTVLLRAGYNIATLMSM